MKKYFLVVLLAVLSVAAGAQTKIKISGVVVNATAAGIPGVTVRLLNTNFQDVTDAKGAFTIQNVYPGTYTVEASATGFATNTTTVHTNNDTLTFGITLYTSPAVLDEVVVTAQKREELLQEIPLSITSLSSKQVQQYRLWNVRDLSGIVPNFYSADPGDRRNVSGIRGIATTSYDPAVATYIDGVNQFSLDTYIAQLFDVERIEVLRGPQGTLYGRNAMGGVINIITKQPTNKTNAFAEVSVGNHGLQRYSAGFRAPIVKDKLYYGMAALYERSSGFYTNEYYNSKFDKQNSLTTNFYLKYLVSDKWSFTMNAKNNNNRNNGAFPLVYGDEALGNPFKLSQDATTRLKDNTFNTSLSINYVGKGFNFSSQTAYQSNYRFYEDPIDGDFSPIDGVTLINNYGKDWNNVKVFTQEFRFTSSAINNSKWRWTAGAYLFNQNSPTKQTTNFGADAAMVQGPDVDVSLINTTKAKSKGAAAFAQATYAITSKLDITGGLRYDYEKKNQSVLGEYQKDPNPVPLFAYRSDTAASAKFHAFSPKVSIAYKALPNNLLFASYSKGFRAGGLTALAADPSQPALFSYKPEYSNNYEAGIKNTWLKNRLQVNITAFYATITDAQVPTLVLPEAITITKNTGRLSSKGIELETMSQFNNWRFDYNLGYTDASFKTLKVASNGAVADLAGKKQIFTPDVTSMLAAQYGVVLSKAQNINLSLRGEWKYLGKQYFDLANTIAQGGYNLLNARVEIASKNISLVLWGQNIADKNYISYAYDFGAIHLGNPRTYGATVRVSL
jgi:iron complex outermembrane receptor protein